jgi:hypothetical protein
LRNGVATPGVGKWTKIAKVLPGRPDLQCRNRWQPLKKRAPQPQVQADQAQATYFRLSADQAPPDQANQAPENPPLLFIQPAQQTLPLQPQVQADQTQANYFRLAADQAQANPPPTSAQQAKQTLPPPPPPPPSFGNDIWNITFDDDFDLDFGDNF